MSGNGEFSGYRPNGSNGKEVPGQEDPLKVNYFISQEMFNAKNTYVPGVGDTTTYNNQIGCDLTTPYATDIQPFINYQYATQHLNGMNTFRDNTYGAALNISQKIFPFAPVFEEGEAGAVYNLRNATPQERSRIATGDVPDIYPNFDTKLGFSVGFTDNNQESFKKAHWSYMTQDVYSLSPNLAFDFYMKRPTVENQFSLIPAAISIVPTYNDQCISANDGTSGSSGIFSVQNRNTYIYVITPGAVGNQNSSAVVDVQPKEAVTVTESNTILHDTNQEPLQAPKSPNLYQNWAKFGLAVAYNRMIDDHKVSAKFEYTYEAFNALYESNNVVLSVNISF